MPRNANMQIDLYLLQLQKSFFNSGLSKAKLFQPTSSLRARHLMNCERYAQSVQKGKEMELSNRR